MTGDLAKRLDNLSPAQRALFERMRAQQTKAVTPAPSPTDDDDSAPLSFAQARLWFLDRLQPGTPAYNVASAMRLTGPLDTDALDRAFAMVIERHAVLRTVFADTPAGPRQIIRAAPTGGVLIRRLAANLEAARAEATADARGAFDLAAGPVIRPVLIRLTGHDHVLSVTVHHIAADAWSLTILFDEVMAIYRGLLDGTPPDLAPLATSYAAVAADQRARLSGGRDAALAAWWRARLADVPPLDWPAARPRPPVQRFAGASRRFVIPAATATAVEAIGRAHGASLFQTLMAAVQLLIHHHTGQTDFALGAPVANRTRREHEALIGFFVNTLAFRADFSRDLSFTAHLTRLRDEARQILAHQDLPFEQVVDALGAPRDPSRNPVVQAVFAFQNTPSGNALAGTTLAGKTLAGTASAGGGALTVTGLDTDQAIARFDLELHVTRGADGRLDGMAMWDSALFDPVWMTRLVRRFVVLLEMIAADPGRRVSALVPLLDDDRDAIARAAPPAAGPAPLVPRRLAAAAAPDAPAIVDDGGSLSHAGLDAAAGALAEALAGCGVGRGDIVAVILPPGRAAGIAALGAWARGAAYLPLDPRHPPARLVDLVRGSGARAVIMASPPADTGLMDLLRADGVPSLPVTADGVAPGMATATSATAMAAALLTDTDAAYVIYTSGSTGAPKGVVVSHAALAGLVDWHVTAFGVTARSRASLIAGPAFDAAVWEIWPTLAAGGTVVAIPPAILGDGAALCRRLVASGITHAFVPTPLVDGLLDADWPADAALRVMLAGGERLTRRPPATLPFRLVNNYGPTETAVVATSGTVFPSEDPAAPLPDIGGVIAGGSLHVLNRGGHPVGIGMPGLLHIGGRGLARGYLGAPARTAQAFRPAHDGGRLYASGDLAMLRDDGRLDFLGRADDQVKLRGHRIEPVEIAATIEALDGVEDAAVLLRQDGPDLRLAAYVVAATGSAVDTARLRMLLQQRLPAYMVPVDWMVLDALPLTTSGKLDRRALPAPMAAPRAGERMPRTATEQLVARVWAEVLGRTGIAADDDFFALGGHSLAAARVAARLAAAGRPVALAQLFQATTLGDLAAELDRLAMAGAGNDDGDDADPLPPFVAVLPDECPLSPGQARWWFLDRLGADPRGAVISAALTLDGDLDVDRLADSFRRIVDRHTPLRTVVVEHDGAPRAVVMPAPAPWPLPVIDAPSDQAAAIAARDVAAAAFDLARGPFLRTVLIRRGPARHDLVVVLHHMAADGWSLGVLVRELAALYGGASLPPLPARYADLARDAARLHPRDLAWWRQRLDGLPAATDLLPSEATATEDARDRDPVASLSLPSDTAARLHDLARATGTTPFMLLSAAVQIMLARLSGQRDFALGTPVANRNGTEAEAVIGFMVNTLVLRSSLGAADDHTTLRQLLGTIRTDTLAALSHQSLPFDRLVDALAIPRSGTDNPLFRVLVAMQTNDIPDLALPGLGITPRPAPLIGTRLDVEIHGTASAGHWGLSVTFNPARMTHDGADGLLRRLSLVLTAMANQPDTAWHALPVMDAAEAARIDRASRGADTRHPHVPDEILARLADAPDAPALGDAGGMLSRATLHDRAAVLAACLGNVSGRPVGVMAGRGRAHGIGLLGLWLAGAGAMPLDGDLPDARLTAMLHIADPAALIASPDLAARLRALAPACPVIAIDADGHVVEDGSHHPRPTINPKAVAATTTPDSLAYLLFTSGSTGTPKAVAVAWRTLDQLAGWHRARHPEPARTLGFAPTGFDVSLQEAAIAWAEGGCWIVACDATRRDPAALARFIGDHAITRLFLPVVMLHALADHLAEHPDHIPSSVTTVITAGEQLRITPAVRAWCRRSPFRLDNQYGPTETHVVAAELLEAATIDHVSDPWPDRPAIGRPVDGAVLYVTDAQGRVLPDGVAGELRVGGTAPAIGYHRDPDRTAERFVTGPDGGRVYRTGDRVRRLPDGRLIYLGRADDQVKIRGVRVEPGEIEAALGSHPDVAQALVVVRAIAGAATLVAHIEPRVMPGDDAALADALRGHLRARLPDPMIPARWVIAPALPRSANGKLDRRALPDTDGLTLAGDTASAPPATDTEIALAALWAQVLGIDGGSIHAGDDFFALGGHSLRATQLVARIARDLAVDLAVARIFEAPVLADLAAVIDDARTDALASELADLTDADLLALFDDDGTDQDTTELPR
ncbi:amino acid adenylation domain-containing protein [Tistrella sp. BH-R2-4]|uniref:Amino acid adenylation domain-containing protein n=1 Tax=Tistrella arctica TaxID=3133430 RepID=A0ABU9YPW0_9PROT